MNTVFIRCSACLALALGILAFGVVSADATTSPTTPATLAANPLPTSDVGGGPLSSASQCPSSPPGIPSGATVSAPSLNPASSTLTSVVNGQTISLAGHCTWNISLSEGVSSGSGGVSPDAGGPDITLEFDGDLYGPFDTEIPFSVANLYNQWCNGASEGGDFDGVAWAGVMNTSGYCNTNQSGITYDVSTAFIVATYFGDIFEGPVCDTVSFGNWCNPLSELPDMDPLLWQWEACVENPVGNTGSLVCTYANMSPLY
jgi:hypothetical protein